MGSRQIVRPLGMASAIAIFALLSACGGGGGSTSASAGTQVLKLSTAVESQHVASYAGAFGTLAGPGVAAIYTSVVQAFVTGVTSGGASTSSTCPAGGSIDIVAQNAGNTGMQAGETATVTFNQCVGQVTAPAVATGSIVAGSATVQVQSVTGTVGDSASNWSYSATETADNLMLSSTSGTTTVNGTVSFTMSHDAASGITTTTASAPSVTIARNQTTSSGSVNGTVTIDSLAYSRAVGTDPVSDTVSTSGAVSIQVANAVIAFDVSTPTPVTIDNGSVSQGTLQLTTADTTETLSAQSGTEVNITVSSGGKTATYSQSTSDFEAVAGF